MDKWNKRLQRGKIKTGKKPADFIGYVWLGMIMSIAILFVS